MRTRMRMRFEKEDLVIGRDMERRGGSLQVEFRRWSLIELSE